MTKVLWLTIGLLMGCNDMAYAANFAVIKSPPVILNVVIILIAVVCIVSSFKLLDLVRGGLFSKSFQFFMGGFTVLALGQVAVLVHTFEIARVPAFVVPALLVMMIGLFSYGLFEARRILS